MGLKFTFTDSLSIRLFTGCIYRHFARGCKTQLKRTSISYLSKYIKDSLLRINKAVQVIDLYNSQNSTKAAFCQWQIHLSLHSPSYPQQVDQAQPIVGISNNNPVMLIARANFVLALHSDKIFKANKLDNHELAVQSALGNRNIEINLCFKNMNSQSENVHDISCLKILKFNCQTAIGYFFICQTYKYENYGNMQ